MSGPGAQVMSDASTLLIRQKADFLESVSCFEKKNKYKVATLQKKDEELFVEKWDRDAFKNMPNALTLTEESKWWCRICLKSNREFSMDATLEGSDTVAYKFHRPFKCSILCCCVLFNPQEINIADGEGKPLGKVQQDFRCVDAFCNKVYWKVTDASDAVQYVIKDNFCCNSNMCAPSCCCTVHNLDILDPAESNSLGNIQSIFPGCNIRAFCSTADNFKLVLPAEASPDQKALLLGGLMLVDFMMFEKETSE